MSQQPDERDLFRRLGEDARRAHLAAPADLRRRSDRRTEFSAAAGTLAVVAAVLGVILGANGLSGSAAPEQGPAIGPSSPTVPETTRSSPTPDAIPQEAWLSKSDLGFALVGVDAVDVLSPCGRAPVATDLVQASMLSSGSRQGSYHAPGTPSVNTPDGSITQSIVLMRDEQAAMALWFIAQEFVKDCPEETAEDPGAIRYTIADPALPTSSARPTRHLLVKVSTSYEHVLGAPPDAGPDRIDTYVSVLQVGDVVSFLELRGWEASTTDLEDVHRLAHLATVRLLDWRS